MAMIEKPSTWRRAAIALAVCIAVALVLVPAPVGASSQLRVVFLAVGQGDAALYQGPCGEVGLIDANRGAVEEVLAALDSMGTRTLRWVSTSHYDADHIGDVVDVAESSGVTVGAVYDRGGNRDAKDTITYREYYDWATSADTNRVAVDIGDSFALCSGSETVTFTVVSAGTDGTAADGVAVSEENDRGVCLRVTYGQFDLATCGDVNGTDDGSRTDVESAVADSIGDVEFAKVNHHGSPASSNETYVAALSAQASVVSVGKNSHGHPSATVMSRWDGEGDVYQTQAPDTGAMVDGNLTLTTAGLDSFHVMTSHTGVSKTYPFDESGPPYSEDVINFGGADFYGSTAGLTLNHPIVDMAATLTGDGYWEVASDGGIFSFGGASFHGSTGAIALNQPIVGMAATKTGQGYWLVASDGGIFAFGDAQFHGSTGAMTLNKPIVGMTTTPSGNGYWLVASDGGLFAFGDTKFYGSTGAIALNKPVVGMASTKAGGGYWLVASDGGVFAFGDAAFHGSTGHLALNSPVTGMAADPDDKGYWFVAADGGVFAFDVAFFGSAGGVPHGKTIVGMEATPSGDGYWLVGAR